MVLDNAVLYLFIFVFGAVVGSFLNVVIYRLGSGAGLSGRSKCLSCGRTLSARMLVPVLSYLFQRGRCAYCGAKISSQYALVELATGLLFVLSAKVNGLALLALSAQGITLSFVDALTWATLVAIAVYDLKHKIIPDRLAIIFALLAFSGLLLRLHFGILPERLTVLLGPLPAWLDLAAGPLLALPFAALWFFSGGRAMGFGDAKLAWGIGWFLGFAQGLTAVVMAFWIAFIPSLLLLLLPKKRFTMKSEIPFAPFLILGTLAVYSWGIDMLNWVF